jgi:hypothetical protein
VLPMRLPISSLLAAAMAALLPVVASGQEAAPPMPEDPRAPRYHEVERGFHAGFEVGYLTLNKTPTHDKGAYPSAGDGGGRSNGVVVATVVGYDLADWLALSVYGLGSVSSADRSYGSFSLFSVGPDVRASFVAWRDAYGTGRLRLYLHARGGPLWTRPIGLLGNTDFYLAGGPGLEYFTHLRHFSVGLAGDVGYLIDVKSLAFAVVPTVRYTF